MMFYSDGKSTRVTMRDAIAKSLKEERLHGLSLLQRILLKIKTSRLIAGQLF
jgi:hypothetical protein